MDNTTAVHTRRSELLDGYRELHRRIPNQMKGFSDLHRAAVAEGELSHATKELMATAIAVATQCDDCVILHLHEALRAGATEEQVLETLGVAILMGGGSASTAATRALDALHQLTD